MKKKVISRTLMPTPIPVIHTLVIILALDFWNAPEWLWGVVGVYLLILWAGFFLRINKTEEVDIFKEPKEVKTKSTFHQKIDSMMNDAKNQN
tara:strand:+ start:21864 stop:22139 length:276 start_codon:yes stop_codon:yes gene_type:complete